MQRTGPLCGLSAGPAPPRLRGYGVTSFCAITAAWLRLFVGDLWLAEEDNGYLLADWYDWGTCDSGDHDCECEASGLAPWAFCGSACEMEWLPAGGYTDLRLEEPWLHINRGEEASTSPWRLRSGSALSAPEFLRRFLLHVVPPNCGGPLRIIEILPATRCDPLAPAAVAPDTS
jgi:hypothetical protein